jgi:translation initiation factor 2 beta subunit (eIF-2beta)/eIF-5
MTISIEEFYQENTVCLNFNKDFYSYRFPDTKDFYQPYCKDQGIDDQHRLYYHYKLFCNISSLSDIDSFYITNKLNDSFDEEFYSHKYPETKDFHEPHCSILGIDNKHRLFYHWFFYNRDESCLNKDIYYIKKYGINFSKLDSLDIEKFWPIDPFFEKKTNEIVKIGKNKALDSSIVVVGLARNIEKHLLSSLENISKLTSFFNKYKICIYENDSTDDTRQILINYKYKINVIGDDDKSPHLKDFSNERTELLAKYRNFCLDWVKKNAFDYDYVLVVDLDAEGGFSVNGVLNSLYWLDNIHDAGCMGSYSINIKDTLKNKDAYHYDTFAFRLNCYESDDREWASKLCVKVGSEPVLVKSCFGGLALYKTKAFISGSYIGNDCEHVTFHRELYKNNWKVYLNPTSRFASIIENENYLQLNKLKIIDTYQDNTGLGLLNKDLKTWIKTQNFSQKFQNNPTLLIPGRPDEYKFINNISINNKIFYWTTFESTQLPKDWVDSLNQAAEIFVPHKSVCQNFINSGVTTQISVVEQPYQRYIRTKNLTQNKPSTINIGFNGLPVNRKNVAKLLQAINEINVENKKFHLYLKIPRFVNKNNYQNYINDNNITVEIADYSFEQMSEWYSNLDAYIYPSSGEGWSFTPRESLYLGIPTVATDIDVHEELLKYCCVIQSSNMELAYYEFGQCFYGHQKQYSVDDIKNSLNILYNNYDHYLNLAKIGSQSISGLWSKEQVYSKLFQYLEPENLLICPSQHKLCGINHYTEDLQEHSPNTKYIKNIEDIEKYDLNIIKNIHVQHEWSLYDHQKLINLMKELPKHINKQITLHSVVRQNSEIQKEIISSFDEIFVLCSDAKSIDKKITYATHGANPDLYCGDIDLVEENKDSKIIGTFGFLHQNKGYDYVAEAIENLDFKYKIIATGNNNNTLIEKLRSIPRIDLDNNVYSIEKIYENLKSCKALIFYYQEENLFFTSGAILKAGRFGLPIITSDECMFKDLGNAVHRVEKQNPSALKEAILKLNDIEYCRYLVKNMKNLLKTREWRNCAKQFI